MRVKMLEDAQVTVDGVNTVDAAAGDELEMGDGVAESLIAAGRAEPADAGSSDAGEGDKRPSRRRGGKKAPAEEAKADGAADENKGDDGEEPPTQ